MSVVISAMAPSLFAALPRSPPESYRTRPMPNRTLRAVAAPDGRSGERTGRPFNGARRMPRMADRPIRIAVIGLGMAVKPHAQSLSDLQAEGQVEGLGAWSRSAERRAAFAAAFPLPVTADLEALLARPDLDAALVVTPPDAREALVQQLASAGKHILMEKPVERTTEAAERIVQRCEAADVT